MESNTLEIDFGPAVHVSPPQGVPEVCVVCEHASNRIPEGLKSLGLSKEELLSHVAWDPGALPVAEHVTELLSAIGVYGGLSRLVYDCNRPPDAESAMPAKSEKYAIPGNASLSEVERRLRVKSVYEPFSNALSDALKTNSDSLKLMVTIHSFNPTYNTKKRATEIGLLHGQDDRFARAMQQNTPEDFPFRVALNEPYSASDGVAHTLDMHGVANGLLNVMIEIRNDLIETDEQQKDMASHFAPWIQETLNDLGVGQ
jgi:predicted N-formylglutamate amidohydrolase